MNKLILILAVIAVLVVGGYYIFFGKPQMSPQSDAASSYGSYSQPAYTPPAAPSQPAPSNMGSYAIHGSIQIV